MVDKCGVVDDFLNISLAARIMFDKSVHIKYNTLINTVSRLSGMKNATVDKYDITRIGSEFFLIHGHLQ